MPSAEPTLMPYSSVPASAMPLISPKALLHAHLRQDPPKRPSARAPSDSRPIQLNVASLSHCHGSSLIKIGATTVVCGVRAEILPVTEIASFRATKSSSAKIPAPAPQDEVEQELEFSPIFLYNLIVPNIELATGCSPNHPANTPPSVEAQSISHRLLSLLRITRLVRTSDLEIIYTPLVESQDPEFGISADPQLKAYWTLYVDLICISHGGSIFDAAWLALYAALQDTILPQAWWDADQDQVLCSADVTDARRLTLRGMPVPATFGVFVPEPRLNSPNSAADQFWVLMDLDGFEEESCHETGCVTVDVYDRGPNEETLSILRIEKNGGSCIGVDQITEVAACAARRWHQWRAILNKITTTSTS